VQRAGVAVVVAVVVVVVVDVVDASRRIQISS
jgi:hypothetical protein